MTYGLVGVFQQTSNITILQHHSAILCGVSLLKQLPIQVLHLKINISIFSVVVVVLFCVNFVGFDVPILLNYFLPPPSIL